MNFAQFVEKYASSTSQTDKFNPLGKTYYANNHQYSGYYWYYETPDYIIDIHNLHIKVDFIQNMEATLKNHIAFMTNYVISGSGEWFNPHQPIKPFTLFVVNPLATNNNYILHKNSRYFAVGLKIKPGYLEKYCLAKHFPLDNLHPTHIFLATKHLLTKTISNIAMTIVTCQYPPKLAKVFFHKQIEQWLDLTLKTYNQLASTKPLTTTDQHLIKRVADYIDKHYTTNIPQKLLTKIACMSNTKLKNNFKTQYNLSITEYLQRKRINTAENLLLNTNLPIKAIARIVGYHSISRFSSLYKRYKAIYPSQLRQ